MSWAVSFGCRKWVWSRVCSVAFVTRFFEPLARPLRLRPAVFLEGVALRAGRGVNDDILSVPPQRMRQLQVSNYSEPGDQNWPRRFLHLVHDVPVAAPGWPLTSLMSLPVSVLVGSADAVDGSIATWVPMECSAA